MIKKLKLDNDNTYPIDVIVSWAISAKSAPQTCYGFSPNQLVFGKSANLPSNLVNLPPTMEDVSHADILVKHLNAPYAARKAFIEAESNDKLRKALKAKNREARGIECYYIRIHPCSLQLISNNNVDIPEPFKKK